MSDAKNELSEVLGYNPNIMDERTAMDAARVRITQMEESISFRDTEIEQLRKDKAELVDALDTILTAIDNGSPNIMISVEMARDTFNKHGASHD